MARPFKTVNALHPNKSVFDLSYPKLFTCDMGQLIPVCHDEVVPGDYFEIGAEAIIRFQPLVAPVLHEINCYVHYFFVPYRLLFNEDLGDTGNWEDFITGGVDGTDNTTLPTWIMNDAQKCLYDSLWNYLGFPYNMFPDGAYPLDFPRRAYYRIWNEYYRDETLQTELDITDYDDNWEIKLRNWSKDYFTSCLPWQQRCPTAPALPLTGTAPVEFDDGINPVVALQTYANPPQQTTAVATDGVGAASGTAAYVDFSQAATFDVSDLRLAFQIQKWMERNARAGARYTSFLYAHFGVSPRDDRLQRCEYFGGAKMPVIISEVLQTSSTDGTSPQGNMAGHGLTVGQMFCGKYHVKEYGLIMGIMSVMPKPMYTQGINRQWLRTSRYDFYHPEFANLSEQGVLMAELCPNSTSLENNTIFGYQGRYDEMRYKPAMVVSEMQDTYSYWHLAREFDIQNPPDLNEEFIECIPDKRIFAAPSEPGLIVHFGNHIKAVRPLPISAEPGLIDHS